MLIIVGRHLGKVRVIRKGEVEPLKTGFASVEAARDWIVLNECDCGNILEEDPAKGCPCPHHHVTTPAQSEKFEF